MVLYERALVQFLRRHERHEVVRVPVDRERFSEPVSALLAALFGWYISVPILLLVQP